MPKITIIIPTYNSSKFIDRTIISVLNQTISDWELLIIDDCSTDNTIELVNEVIKKDQRIKLLKTPQNSGGPATPKNIGIESAVGEYVAFLDHDDEWLPKKLEKQLKIFEESKDSKLGFVSCFISIKNNNTKKLVSKYNKFYNGNIIKKIVNSNFIYTCSSIVTKLSIIKEVGLFDSNFKMGDDWDMWIRISNAGYKFNFAPEYLLNYFVHDKNVCYGNNNFNDGKEFSYFYNKNKKIFIENNSLMVGYNFYVNKNYKKAVTYYLNRITSGELTIKEVIKSFGFIILSIFPSLEKLAKKIWRVFN